ncbi:MAG: MerC domain-containing protein [Chitinophagaceae bacterium]
MKLKINLDGLGIATSVACAIHCALLPLFFTSLPLFGINIIHNLTFEIVMIVAALGIGSFSLIHGYAKHHHRMLPLLVFLAGFIFLVLKELYHENELWLLLPAVLLILTAHFLNYYYCRQSNHCHVDDCDH